MNGLLSDIRRLIDVVGQVGMWMIVPIMLLVLAEVVLRSVVGISLIGVNETVEFMLVAFVFLGLARSSLNRVHVTVTLLTENMSQRTRDAIGGLMSLAAAAVWWLACWQTVLDARQIQLSQVMSPTIAIPIHPFIYLAGLGCGLMGLAQLVDVITSWCGRSEEL